MVISRQFLQGRALLFFIVIITVFRVDYFYKAFDVFCQGGLQAGIGEQSLTSVAGLDFFEVGGLCLRVPLEKTLTRNCGP